MTRAMLSPMRMIPSPAATLNSWLTPVPESAPNTDWARTSFVTRVDFPLYTSRPDLAQDQHPGGDEFGFRWLFSFEAAW